MHKTPPRIQRFIMFLEKYDSVVNYVPGKDLIWEKVFKNGTSNICGRQPLKNCYTLNTLFHLLRHFKQSTTQRPKPRNIRDRSKLPSLVSRTQLLHQHIKIKIEVETTNDNTLQSYVAQRWPRSRNQLNTGLKPYQNFRDELTVLNNLIFKGSKIIIPST